jgi:hypothetical protein
VNWLWLNVPLMAVFFLAMAGIPLWLVFKHPDTGPVPVPVPVNPAPIGVAPVVAPGRDAPARELAGASS